MRAGARRLPLWAGVPVAIALVAATLLLRIYLYAGDQPLIFLFVFPIMASAFLGGIGAGLIATLLSGVAADYFLLPPLHSLMFGKLENHVQLVVLLATGVALTLLLEGLDRSRSRVERGRALLSVALGSIGDAVILTDNDGRITFLNAEAERLTGWARPDALGKTLSTVFTIKNEKTGEPVESPVDKVLHLGSVVGLANHTVLVAKDGREIPIDDSGAPVREADGTVHGVVLVFRDFTERRKAEEKLLRAKEEWERTFASVPDMVAIIDNEHRILRVNEAMARRLGRSPGECAGLLCFEAVHGLSEPPDFCPHAKSLKDGLQHIEEVHEERLGGDFVVSASPLHDQEGRMIGTVHVAHDITERKAAGERLRESEELYRSIVETATEGVWIGDTEARTTFVNRRMADMLGYSPEELAGRSAYDFMDEEARVLAESKLEERRQGLKGSYEQRYIRKDGTTLWALTSGAPLRNKDGHIVASLAILADITERKATEEALSRSEERYRSLFNGMTEGFALHEIICDERDEPTDYRFLEMNPAFERLTGLTREDVIGRIVSEVLPGIEPFWIKTYGEVALTGQATRFVSYAAPLQKHYEVFAYRPAPRQFAVLFMDVTERKRLEEETRRLLSAVVEEKDRLSALIDSINDEVWFADTSKRFVLANPSALREFGFEVGKDIEVEKLAAGLEVYRPDGTPRPVDEAPPLRALEGEVFRNQIEIVRTPATGELRHRQVSAAPVRDGDGKIIGAVSVVHDITDLKRAEEALQEAYEGLEQRVKERTAELRSLIEASLDPLVTISRDGKISDVNVATELVTGCSRQELIGTDFADYFTDPERARQGYERVFAEESVRDYPLDIRHRDGGITPVLYNASVYRNDGGSVIGVFAAARDVSDRQKLEAQLRQAQKMEALGTLSGGIAHDFNNILAAIIGFTELVADHIGKGGREERHVKRILEASLRGRDLVRQLLAFSRKAEQEKKPLRVGSIVKETVRLVRASTPTTISIKTKIAGDAGLIFADPTQIQQVLMNLCTNAAYAMRERGGVLDIELSNVRISPSEENLHGIEPGPYVKLMVRDTTFTVYFPEISEEQQTQGAEDAEIPTGSERILFVDDEEALIEVGEDILAELGYEVTSRMNGRAALSLLKEDPSRFDLVITDVTMPEMTGLDLAREVLLVRPDLPIIMCTGFSHLVNADTARAAGIRAFAMKPLTKKEIARTIRQVLGE